MKTAQKLWILYFALLISIFPSCISMHEPASTQPTMSFKDATNSMKGAISDAKNVTDIAVSEKGVTLFLNNKEKSFYEFKTMKDPFVYEDNTLNQNIYLVILSGSVWTTTDDNCVKFNNSKSARVFADALYYLKHHDVKQELERGHEDCLRVVRSTAINVILNGSTTNELALPCEVNMEAAESILNELLIQWKNKGFPEQLQKSSPSQLRDLVIDLEKGIVKLDLKVKKLKDLADEDARQVTVPGQAAPAKKAPGALSLSHILDQRKTLLMVILGLVKQAAAQRA